MGTCEREFGAAAHADGIDLVPARVPWLNQRGHLGLPEAADSVRGVLADIFTALGGEIAVQAGKRLTPLPGDFIHPPTGTLVEVDESQHFTSHRLLTLQMYPAETPLGYDIDCYRRLCTEWAPIADRTWRHKAAVAFGPGGRSRQRAYHDAVRDLAASAMGHPPVIRVPAPDRDGRSAYASVRDRLSGLRG